MKILPLSFFIATALVSGSCSTTKSTSKSTSPTPALVVATPPLPSKPADGIYPPGNDELTAIHARNPNVTMEHLNEGYLLYTKGACINCHSPENIYKFPEKRWVAILDDMAQKANISTSQKAAVYAYILSIKDNQPK